MNLPIGPAMNSPANKPRRSERVIRARKLLSYIQQYSNGGDYLTSIPLGQFSLSCRPNRERSGFVLYSIHPHAGDQLLDESFRWWDAYQRPAADPEKGVQLLAKAYGISPVADVVIPHKGAVAYVFVIRDLPFADKDPDWIKFRAISKATLVVKPLIIDRLEYGEPLLAVQYAEQEAGWLTRGR